MSIRSMTGFGRGSGSFRGTDFTIDVKSVNHRFFDYSSRIYKEYAFLEDPIKKSVSAAVFRGKVDVFFHTEKKAGCCDASASVDDQLAGAYLEAARRLSESFGISNDLTASVLLQLPNVLSILPPEVDESEIQSAVLKGVDQALESFTAMREAEGKKLQCDLEENLDYISSAIEKIELLAPESVKEYRRRLEEKIKETLEDRTIDESRILTEVAIFADRVAVDEETVRLKSHIHQFRGLLKQGGPVGKKLDFLVQEMNREINTTGSKCSSIEITRIVLDVKSCIEKIREQIQNVE